ncbi:transposase [Hymenobacter lutimineralis]|uniref:Transposase n=1 Tax=Hymenobacter lutimineralis TaxID=2606448 RepID=A0A5D6V9W9_9BACT|nr:transposase [Hymenobacter lutimineralis]
MPCCHTLRYATPIFRHSLTDAQWERLWPLLPGQERSPGPTAKDTRFFVEAVR